MRLAYRPFQAATLALLAALVTACAAFAPLYDRAMQQSLTDLELSRATPAAVGLRVTAAPSDIGGNDTAPPPEEVVYRVPRSLRAAYGTPILEYDGDAYSEQGVARKTDGLMRWREGQCDHVTVVAGRCPEEDRELGISPADARQFGLRPGSRIRVAVGSSQPGETGEVTMRVTGILTQDPDPAFWTGEILDGQAGAPGGGSDVLPHDTWLTGRATFEGGAIVVDGFSLAQLPLDPATVDVDDLMRIAGQIDALSRQVLLPRAGSQTRVYSGLRDIAADVRRQTAQSRVTVPLLMAQLVLLAAVVLWLVLLAVTEQRRPEVALARLRGRGRRGATAYLLAELLPVVLAGVVPGALLAVLAAWVARSLLPGSAGFELGRGYAVALLLAVAVLLTAAVVAALRVAREPLAVLLRRVPSRRSGWGLGVADVLLVAGSGGVVLGFLTGGLDGPVALAAPGLLAVVVGLVLAHLITPLTGRWGRRLLGRGRLRLGLAVVDAARNPATRRVVTVVTLATALAVFAGDAVLVGSRNRAEAAEQRSGAPVVARVDGSDLPALRAAVSAADHAVGDGHGLATTVVRSLPPGSEDGGTLSVVPGEFRRVALLPPGAAAELARLREPPVEPVRLTGTRVTLDVDDSTLYAQRTDAQLTPVTVGLDLVGQAGRVLHTTLGELAGRTDHVRLTAEIFCADGCEVAGVWLGTLPGARIQGTATLTRLTDDTGPVALGPADRWTSDDGRDPDGPGRFAAGDAATPASLQVDVKTRGAPVVTLESAWAPARVPALVSPPDPSFAAGGWFTTVGIDGDTQDAVRAGDLSRVPGARPGTVVVDLDLVQRTRSVAAQATMEVWLAHDDPALLSALRRELDRRGLSLGGVTTIGEVRESYDSSTAAWSLQLAVLVGLAALLVAALVLVVGAASAWRLRTRDLAALRMAGVPRRTVAGVVVAAQLPAVVVGLVAGAVSGLVGAQLALPIVPLFASAPEVSTLDLSTAWPGVLVAAALAVLVLASTAVATGRALARRSGVRRLRETL